MPTLPASWVSLVESGYYPPVGAITMFMPMMEMTMTAGLQERTGRQAVGQPDSTRYPSSMRKEAGSRERKRDVTRNHVRVSSAMSLQSFPHGQGPSAGLVSFGPPLSSAR